MNEATPEAARDPAEHSQHGLHRRAASLWGVWVIAGIKIMRWNKRQEFAPQISRAAVIFVLAAGVSPRSGGKTIEPRSSDTGYDTDSWGAPAPLAHST
jgi:hypothetical protein